MTINRSDLVSSQELFKDEPLTIADILESIRECEELSCSDMAKKLGISRQHYNGIVQGETSVGIAKAAQYADALGQSNKVFIKVAIEELLRRNNLDVSLKDLVGL